MKQIIKKMGTDPLHEEVLILLPWLVNNTLESDERLKVLNHLSDCRECQLERDKLQQLELLVRQDDETEVADYKPSFGKLMAQIDRADQVDESDDLTSSAPASPTAKPPVWGYVVAMAAAIVLMVVGVNLVQEPTQIDSSSARTLSIPATSGGSSVNGVSVKERLSITFDENIDSEVIRSVFVNTGAYIVEGPDSEGRYVVEMVLPSGGARSELLDSVVTLDGVKHAALLE